MCGVSKINLQISNVVVIYLQFYKGQTRCIIIFPTIFYSIFLIESVHLRHKICPHYNIAG